MVRGTDEEATGSIWGVSNIFLDLGAGYMWSLCGTSNHTLVTCTHFCVLQPSIKSALKIIFLAKIEKKIDLSKV